MSDPAATAGAQSIVVDGVNVDDLTAALSRLPGVRGVGTNQPGAAATYLPGRRVPGIRVEDHLVTVEVCVEWGVDAKQLQAAVQSSLTPLAGGRTIQVVIADIELPDQGSAAPPVETPPSSLPESE